MLHHSHVSGGLRYEASSGQVVAWGWAFRAGHSGPGLGPLEPGTRCGPGPHVSPYSATFSKHLHMKLSVDERGMLLLLALLAVILLMHSRVAERQPHSATLLGSALHPGAVPGLAGSHTETETEKRS